MAVTITNGIALITSQVDFESCVATPTAAADTTTSPGNLLLAAGYNDVVITSPAFEFDPFSQWLFLTVAGTRAERTVYLIRWRVAATELALAGAAYTPWENGIQADGTLGINMAAFWANNAAWEAGPWLQWQLRILR